MNIFDDYDYEKKYEYAPDLKCNHFSKLMFLIINVNNISNGHTILKDYVICNRDEINNKNAKGWTALHIAARNSNIYSSETVRLLLENGANINLTDEYGLTALMLAVRYSNKESSLDNVRLLLEKGTNVNLATKDGWTVLIWAARYSNTEGSLGTVKLLLDNDADVNLTNEDGWTALMIAINYSNTKISLETVKILLEKGANVNLPNRTGWTALMVAAFCSDTDNSLEIVKLLIENGANMYIKNEDGGTFFNYIPIKYLRECLNIAHQIEHHKLCMKKLLKPINKKSIELLLCPDSLRIKLMGIKWSSNDNLFEELSIEDPSLLDYFGITDEEILRWKIMDNLKYVD